MSCLRVPWIALGLVLSLCICATDAHAKLIGVGKNRSDKREVDANRDVDTTNDDSGYFQKLQDCLDEIEKVPSLKAILDCLVQSSEDHYIVLVGPTPAKDAMRDPDKQGRSNSDSNCRATHNANSVNGMGSGSVTRWNATSTRALSDDIPRDPCAVLIHELTHAKDIDQGVIDGGKVDGDTSKSGSGTIEVAEIRAVRFENEYRRSQGLPTRTEYGHDDLPKGVIYDRCPDGICIFAESNTTMLETVDAQGLTYEVPLPGTRPGTMTPREPIPGSTIAIKDGTNTTLATVTVIKDRDGLVTLRLMCQTALPVTVTQIQWKNDGSNLGAPMPINPPLACSQAMPTAMTAPPFAPPAVPE